MPAPIASKKISAVAQLVKNEPELLSVIREGEIVAAKLIKRMPRAAYFDLGKAGTGVIYGLEFMNAKETLKKLAAGFRSRRPQSRRRGRRSRTSKRAARWSR